MAHFTEFFKIFFHTDTAKYRLSDEKMMYWGKMWCCPDQGTVTDNLKQEGK